MSKQPEKIEDIFKEKFEAESNLDLGWNTPPDFIFEESIYAVNAAKKKSRRNKLIFCFTTGAVAIGLLLFVTTYSKLSKLEDRIDKIEITQVADNKADNSLLSTTQNNNPTINTAISAPKHDALVSNAETKLTTAKKSTTNTITTKAETKASVPFDNKQIAAANSASGLINNYTYLTRASSANATTSPESTTALMAQPSATISDQSQPIVTLSALPGLPTLNITSIDSQSPLAPIKDAEDLTAQEMTVNKRALVAQLNLVNNTSTFSMSGVAANDQQLTNYDSYYQGIGIELNLGLPLSDRLAWNNKLAYNKINNESTIDLVAAYNKSNEKEMFSGMTMYEETVMLQSPIGALEQTILFEVEPSSTVEGTAINEQVALAQCTDVISVASGLEYSFIQRPRWEWKAGFQLGAAYISKINSQLDTEISMTNEPMVSETSTMTEINEVNNLFGFAELTTGFGIQLPNNYSLNLGMGYQHSLSSLRSTSNGGPGTQLINWTSRVGISKRF